MKSKFKFKQDHEEADPYYELQRYKTTRNIKRIRERELREVNDYDPRWDEYDEETVSD